MLNGGCELRPVISGRDDVGRIVANHPITMVVIESLLAFVFGEQGIFSNRPHVGPAHVRQLEARIAAGIQALHVRRDPAEPARAPFLASAAEQLHSEADAEHRSAPLQRHLVERVAPAAVQRRHTCVERTNAREHQSPAVR
jgi:hypothetical protein